MDERDARHGRAHPTYPDALAAMLIRHAPGPALPPRPHAAQPRRCRAGWLGVVADGPLTDPAFAVGRRVGPARGQRRRGRARRVLLAPDPARRRRRRRLQRHRRARRSPPPSAGSACCRSCRARRPGRRCNPGDRRLAPARPGDFAAFLTALVTRYGPNGSFWAEHPEVVTQPIRAWQIWNEPNLTRYWNVGAWAPPYVKLLKAAHAALQATPTRARRRSSPACRTRAGRRCSAIYDAGARGALRRRRAAPVHGQAENVIRIVKIVAARRCARHERRQAADLDHRALVAGRGGQDAEQRGRLRRRPTPARPSGCGRADAARRGPPGRCGSSASTGTRGCRQEGVTGSAFDYSGLRRIRGGQLVDAPALAIFTREARSWRAARSCSGNAARCR